MHLENPTDALRKLTMALKSGGYIVLEEPDFSTFLTEGEPKDSLVTVRHAFGQIEAAISSKRMSLYLGRKLPAILDNLDLENVVTDEHCTIQNGGSKLASIHCKGWSILMRQGMADKLTKEAYTSAVAHMNDPNFLFKDSANVGVWGRK